MTKFLDSYFKISQRGSSVSTEIRGGLVTFFTMAYIVALNPIILAYSPDANGQFLFGGAAPAPAMVAATTALIAGLLTILMGSVANYPLALATGLGLNTFVAVGIASKMTWAAAMGLVVLEGLIILVLVLTGFRVAVFKAVPAQIKIAISVGIGLFIALIGLVDAGFVRKTASGPVPVGLGVNGNLVGWPTVVFVFGLILMIGLMVRKVKGAILIGIVGATVVAVVVQKMYNIAPGFTAGNPPKIVDGGWGLNIPNVPTDIVATPKFDFTGQFDLFGAFQLDNVTLIAAILLLFTLLLSDFFDTVGTVTAIGHEAGLADKDGNVDDIQKILLVDSLAAAAGGAAGISSNTSYIESASGVGEGARTGLASIVTGICFLLTTFLAPLVAIIPYEAATPALIIVGFLMMTQIKNIDWDDLGIAIPAFLTIILMPFTYNISVGIGAGFITHVLIRVFQGRGKEVHALLYFVSGLFMIYFLSSPINNWTA
ncbi:MAG: NCS2 family permease [Actinobacteria bacterium]|nr:NCS2 family permease [Actinomycetota bacterium]